MWDDRRGGVLVRSARIAELADESTRLEWLTTAERRELERYRDSRRRTAWLCGRSLGKRLIIDALGLTWGRFPTCPNFPMYAGPDRLETCPTEVEILSRDRSGRAVRPVVRVRGVERVWSLSISHTDRLVIAALAKAKRHVGIDLVSLQDVNPSRLRPWFTVRESELLRLDDLHEAARAWAIKEAAYKALNDGEPFTPRRIELTATPTAISRNGVDLHGFCTVETWDIDDHVAALVTAGGSQRRAATKRAADHSLPSLSPA